MWTKNLFYKNFLIFKKNRRHIIVRCVKLPYIMANKYLKHLEISEMCISPINTGKSIYRATKICTSRTGTIVRRWDVSKRLLSSVNAFWFDHCVKYVTVRTVTSINRIMQLCTPLQVSIVLCYCAHHYKYQSYYVTVYTVTSVNRIILLRTPLQVSIVLCHCAHRYKCQSYYFTMHTITSINRIILLCTPLQVSIVLYYFAHRYKCQSYYFTVHTIASINRIMLLCTPLQVSMVLIYCAHRYKYQSYYNRVLIEHDFVGLQVDLSSCALTNVSPSSSTSLFCYPRCQRWRDRNRLRLHWCTSWNTQ